MSSIGRSWSRTQSFDAKSPYQKVPTQSQMSREVRTYMSCGSRTETVLYSLTIGDSVSPDRAVLCTTVNPLLESESESIWLTIILNDFSKAIVLVGFPNIVRLRQNGNAAAETPASDSYQFRTRVGSPLCFREDPRPQKDNIKKTGIIGKR